MAGNKYFELKTCGTAALTRTTCCLQLQVRTRQYVRAMQQHMPIQQVRAHSFTQAWAHRHRQTAHTFYFLLNTSSFGVVPSNLASHAHVILTSHTENSFEYKQHTLLETLASYLYVFTAC